MKYSVLDEIAVYEPVLALVIKGNVPRPDKIRRCYHDHLVFVDVMTIQTLRSAGNLSLGECFNLSGLKSCIRLLRKVIVCRSSILGQKNTHGLLVGTV